MTEALLYTLSGGLIVLAVVLCMRYGDVFHPIPNQACLVALLIGLRAILVNEGMDSALEGISAESLSELLLETTIFYLGFFALAIITYKWSAGMLRPLFAYSWDTRTIRLGGWTRTIRDIPILYIVTGIVSLAILSLKVGLSAFLYDPVASRSTFAGNYFLFFGIVSPVYAAMVYYLLWVNGDKSMKCAALGVTAITFGAIGTMLTGARGYLIMLLIGFMAGRSLILKKTIFKLLLLYLAFIAVFLPVMDGLVYGRLWESISTGDFSQVIPYWSEHFVELFSYAYGRYYTLEGTARTLLFLDTGEAIPDEGRLILAFPRILLPTTVVGWKPSVTQEIAHTFFYDRYGAFGETSAVTSLPAFMYWQLGWIGYVMGAAAYGIFLRYWVTIYERGGLGNAIYIALLYPYCLLLFCGHIGSLAELIYLHIIFMPLLTLKRWKPVATAPAAVAYAHPTAVPRPAP